MSEFAGTDWYDLIDNFVPVGGLQYMALISRRDAGTDLHVNVATAVAAAEARLRTLDHVRRTYVDEDRIRQPLQPSEGLLLRQAYELADDHMQEARRQLRPSDDLEPTLGEFAASIALERIPTTLKSVHLLFLLGHRLDADTLARAALEQIAWAFVVAPMDSAKDLDRALPTECIKQLKGFYPPAGPLYGRFTDSAHERFRGHLSRFSPSPEGNRVTLREATLEHGSYVLLFLGDVWTCVWEATQQRHMGEVRSVGLLEGRMQPKPDRALLIEAVAHEERIRAFIASQGSEDPGLA